MIDFWFLEATFWQQLYYICSLCGIGIFMYAFIEAIQKAKKDFIKWKNNYMENEWPKIMAESQNVVDSVVNRLKGDKK